MEKENFNPMNDVLFKFIFGKDERKHITIDLINSMLNRTGENKVVDVTFKNVEIIPLEADGKLTRLDIFCVLNSGEKLDLEIQVTNQQNMGRRTLYYWAQMYLFSLKRGEDYQQLFPTVTINLLSYNFLPQENPHAVYGVYNLENKHKLTEDLELHFYEIPKFNKKPMEKMTKAEKWLAYFAKKLDKEEATKMGETAIIDAFDAVNNFMMSEEQRLAYINREMAIMDYNTNMRVSREEGQREGRNEATANIAKNMLSMGLGADIIEQATGLQKSAILKMQSAN